MATITETQLGQARPSSGATPEALVTPSSVTAIAKSIMISNVSGSSATYRIYHDDDGTTYDQSTALFYDVAIEGGATHILSVYLPIVDGGNLAVESNTGNALTFTAYGLTIS